MFISAIAYECIAAMTFSSPFRAICVCPADGSLQSNTPDAASISLQHQSTMSNDQKVHDALCIWDEEDFVVGNIPEDPPPFELCH